MLAAADFKPDLIILDLNLPKISRHALMERLGKPKPRRCLYFIFESSRKRTGSRMGPIDHLQKPIGFAKFTPALRGMISTWAVPEHGAASR